MQNGIDTKEENRLILVRKNKSADKRDSSVIRIDKGTYGQVLKLAADTGDSITQIATKLLQFAIDHTDLVDEV
jgi:hypothetical protein